jgi:hypothetical protein
MNDNPLAYGVAISGAQQPQDWVLVPVDIYAQGRPVQHAKGERNKAAMKPPTVSDVPVAKFAQGRPLQYVMWERDKGALKPPQ